MSFRGGCVVFCVLVLAAGCGGDDKPAAAPVDAAYRREVQAICNVMAESGAQTAAAQAQWLAEHVTSDAGRAFMIGFKQADKPGDALRAEAARVGLPDCPLATMWE